MCFESAPPSNRSLLDPGAPVPSSPSKEAVLGRHSDRHRLRCRSWRFSGQFGCNRFGQISAGIRGELGRGNYLFLDLIVP